MTTIRIGPYEIQSEDAFLDQEDLSINYETGMETSLAEVASYIDMTELQCNSKMATAWRKALSGHGNLFLYDAEDYLDSRRSIRCNGEPRELLAAPGVEINECALVIGEIPIPIMVSTKESYPELLDIGEDPTMKKLGGRVSSNAPDWKFHTGNCHSYALHEHLAISPNIAFSDIQGSGFYLEEIPGDSENVYLASSPYDNGFERALATFYKPVGFISSEEIPLPPLLYKKLLELLSPEEMGYFDQITGTIEDLFDLKLKEMLASGMLTYEKLRQRKYVFTMGHKMSVDIPGGKGYAMLAAHSAILLFNGNTFSLEAKLSFSEQVYESSIAAQAIIYSAASANSLFTDSMMYRIYEPELDDGPSRTFNLEEALQGQPGTDHPLFFKKIPMPKAKAEEILAIIKHL